MSETGIEGSSPLTSADWKSAPEIFPSTMILGCDGGGDEEASGSLQPHVEASRKNKPKAVEASFMKSDLRVSAPLREPNPFRKMVSRKDAKAQSTIQWRWNDRECQLSQKRAFDFLMCRIKTFYCQRPKALGEKTGKASEFHALKARVSFRHPGPRTRTEFL